jgi:hypothetical protein
MSQFFLFWSGGLKKPTQGLEVDTLYRIVSLSYGKHLNKKFTPQGTKLVEKAHTQEKGG